MDNIKKFLLIMTAIILFAFFSVGCQGNKGVNQEEAVAVEVYRVSQGEIKEIVTLPGQLTPSANAMVVPLQPGLKVTDLAVKLGDMVKDGDLLFQLDKTLARKQVEQAKANYDFAREGLQMQKLALQQQQSQLEAVEVFQQSKLMQVFSNPIPQINSSFGGEETLRAAEMQVEQARSLYSNSIQMLSELEYYAPISGVISQLNIEKNQAFLGNGPALVISNIDNLKVPINVAKDLLGNLAVGNRVAVRYNDVTKEGEIKTLNPVGDPRSGLYLAEINISNGDGTLSSGSFVQVDITKNHKLDTIVIPKDAVIDDEGGSYVYIVKKDRAVKREIKTGISGRDTIEILEGLEVDDRVLVKGQHFVQDNGLVWIRGEEIEDD